jgi:ribosomal protein S18 acetylase RimI-like enzyme
MRRIVIREIGLAQIDLLLAVTPGLFDEDIRPDQSLAFLSDPSNILFLAHDGDLAVGMVTATILRHPDKPPALFVNELGTRDSHLRQGIATALLQAMLAAGRERGCQGIWLGTEPDNEAALGLYRKLGGEEEDFVGFGWDDAF